jgi:hypothetical protein
VSWAFVWLVRHQLDLLVLLSGVAFMCAAAYTDVRHHHQWIPSHDPDE